MKTIQLTKGKYALVDNEDFSELSQYKWCAYKFGKTWRAFRGITIEPGKHRIEYMHHRIIPGEKGMQVDHINRNGLDNRKENLRLVSVTKNQLNVGLRKDNCSGYKGVRKHRDKWQAFIIIHKKFINLGSFDTPEKAYQVRKDYEIQVIPE